MAKQRLFTLIIFLGFSVTLCAQSIRKSHTEMTDTEIDLLVTAFYAMRGDHPSFPNYTTDLVDILASFHANNFPAIHFNIGPNPPVDPLVDVVAGNANQFVPWHRMQMWEMEQIMKQVVDQRISMPYWDTSVYADQSDALADELWNVDFMGQFDDVGLWSFGGTGIARNLGAAGTGFGELPTPGDVITLQALPGNNAQDYYRYTLDNENGAVHTGAHRWTGGVMRTGLSPQDPVFYLHHTNVDRLATQWYYNNQASLDAWLVGNRLHTRTVLSRYDGTVTINGFTPAAVDPDLIMDSRTLGVFYANSPNSLTPQTVQLNNYTVGSVATYAGVPDPLNPETFYYQYTIEVGDNFIVPSGTYCTIESVDTGASANAGIIILQDGFHAQSGSIFTARIDNNLGAKISSNPLFAGSHGPSSYNGPIDYTVYDDLKKTVEKIIAENIAISAYPNPFIDRITVDMQKTESDNNILIYDMSGRVIYSKTFSRQGQMNLDNLEYIPNGIYILEVQSDNKTVLRKKFIKK